MPKNNLSKIMTMVQNSTFLILPSLGIDGQGVSFFAPQSTSEQSPLCSGIFLQKCHPLRSLAPPLQTATVALGCGLVLGANLAAASFLAPQPSEKPAESPVFQGLSAGFIFLFHPLIVQKWS